MSSAHFRHRRACHRPVSAHPNCARVPPEPRRCRLRVAVDTFDRCPALGGRAASSPSHVFLSTTATPGSWTHNAPIPVARGQRQHPPSAISFPVDLVPSALPSSPSAGVELDRLDDRCGLGDDFVEACLGRYDGDRQGLNRHALREVDEVETQPLPRFLKPLDPAADVDHSDPASRAAGARVTSIDTALTPPTRGHRRSRLEVGIGDELLRNRGCMGRRREQRGPAVRCAPCVVGEWIDEFDARCARRCRSRSPRFERRCTSPTGAPVASRKGSNAPFWGARTGRGVMPRSLVTDARGRMSGVAVFACAIAPRR